LKFHCTFFVQFSTFLAMPKKTKSYRAELERVAVQAYLEAEKARKALRLAKAAVKLATSRARRLQAAARTIDKSTGEPGGSIGFRRAQARIEDAHWPFYKALAKAKLSVPEFARGQVDPPLGAETARSWMKPNGGRRCPESWARRINKKYPEVPVTDAAWPNGIAWGM
jgi:hypothetical protein